MILRGTMGLALCVILCAAPVGTNAAPSSVAKEVAAIDVLLKTCIDKDSSNVGMKTCTSDAYDATDKILNRLYKSTVAQLKATTTDSDVEGNKETLKRLVASERAWIAYRDTECDLQGTSMLGGTGEGLVIDDCLFSMTKARVKDLDDLFSEK